MKEETILLLEYKRTGDIHLLGQLYAPYMPLVYGLCLKYYQNSARSEDAVMEIFEELVLKLKVHQVHNFKSWLYSLAKNYCLMNLRKEKHIKMIDLDDLDIPDLTEDNFLEMEDNLHLLETCLEQLPIEQQTCLKLFYLEKKCYADIVDITGFEWNKVKSFIQNGKRNLKLCMEKKGYEK